MQALSQIFRFGNSLVKNFEIGSLRNFDQNRSVEMDLYLEVKAQGKGGKRRPSGREVNSKTLSFDLYSCKNISAGCILAMTPGKPD